MDSKHRKELKTDKFAEEVVHSVEFLGEHRQQAIRYGGAALVVVVAAVAWYWYAGKQHVQRQAELQEAIRTYDSAVGPGGSPFLKTFKTTEEKDKALDKEFGELVAKYPSKDEGVIARYYQGIIAADRGKLPEAEKAFQDAISRGNKDYASLAKFALAQVYQTQGKYADAEKLLKELQSNPTILVSKDQATISLGRLLMASNPAEGRKILEPLRTERGAVSRAAIEALSTGGK